MVDLNVCPVNWAVTFVVKSDDDNLRSVALELEEALEACRKSDRLLKDTGMIKNGDFYSNELAYCRTEAIVLKLKHVLVP